MKYLKLFEDFTNDENRGNHATFDHSKNPVIREKVKEYVKGLLHSNQYKIIFDLLGLEAPKDLEGQEMDGTFDDVEQKAIEFLMKHPEQMTIDLEGEDISKMPVASSNNYNVGNALTSNTPVITHT